MAKLHELLAAEKTPNGAWNQLFEETLKKFKNPGHFFDGHSKSLQMIEDSPANKAIEDQAREEKPVISSSKYIVLEGSAAPATQEAQASKRTMLILGSKAPAQSTSQGRGPPPCSV
ncbi:MAG: hypothetical protein HC872_06915 [Gammaproteobacteria bacterium]|nr:hypothetical protein [Gammaproteobacteria bacterium]